MDKNKFLLEEREKYKDKVSALRDTFSKKQNKDFKNSLYLTKCVEHTNISRLWWQLGMLQHPYDNMIPATNSPSHHKTEPTYEK